MNEIREKYLPIGTVVMLKGGTKRVMITGFCSMPAEDTSNMFDYSGCMFPEGFLSSNQTALFNHSQIEKIYHMGLEDDEEKKFKEQLNILVNKMNEVNAGNKTESKEEQTSTETVPPVDTETTDNTENEKLEDVPPVGPGLPGYVEPKSEDVPPVGPGLPGYVEPKLDDTDENNDTTSTDTDITYDENGNVTADFRFDDNQ